VTDSPDAWLFDTDMQIHRLGLDPSLRAAADAKRTQRSPVAVSAYSLLEFKGNYIADLILLRRKVADSSSIKEACARVFASGNRKTELMLAQLVGLLDDTGFDFKGVWSSAQGVLVTAIDAEVVTAWAWFKTSVDRFVDDLNCTRAAEAPRQEKGHWLNERPDCRKDNTKCRVVELMKENETRLQALLVALKAAGTLTDELEKIVTVLEQTARKEFPWQGKTCRSVGDLLISLHAPPRKGLVTSNRAEHGIMAMPLGYALDVLPVGGTRLK